MRRYLLAGIVVADANIQLLLHVLVEAEHLLKCQGTRGGCVAPTIQFLKTDRIAVVCLERHRRLKGQVGSAVSGEALVDELAIQAIAEKDFRAYIPDLKA